MWGNCIVLGQGRSLPLLLSRLQVHFSLGSSPEPLLCLQLFQFPDETLRSGELLNMIVAVIDSAQVGAGALHWRGGAPALRTGAGKGSICLLLCTRSTWAELSMELQRGKAGCTILGASCHLLGSLLHPFIVGRGRVLGSVAAVLNPRGCLISLRGRAAACRVGLLNPSHVLQGIVKAWSCCREAGVGAWRGIWLDMF